MIFVANNKMNNKEAYEYPEVAYFLNLSRIMIRQMDLLKSTSIPQKYKQMTANAAVSIAEEAVNFANEYIK